VVGCDKQALHWPPFERHDGKQRHHRLKHVVEVEFTVDPATPVDDCLPPVLLVLHVLSPYTSHTHTHTHTHTPSLCLLTYYLRRTSTILCDRIRIGGTDPLMIPLH